MPELPEVEVLVRHLAPLLRGRIIKAVNVQRARVIAPAKPAELARRLVGARFDDVRRRGKFLVFDLTPPGDAGPFPLIGHLGMTGRMFLQPARAPLPTHAAVVLHLGRHDFVFEDTRCFGRLTLAAGALSRLGPEPLDGDFTEAHLAGALKRSTQAIKVRLLDQSLVAGVGNLYASEALFRAGIPPRRPARRLTREQVRRLHAAIRQVLAEAIAFGSTVPLDWPGRAGRDSLFYYGSAPESAGHEERLLVYDREGRPCARCGAVIRRIVQAARSTFYCPQCQRG